MSKKLAIIGASYLQEPLIQKAKSMGIETHVFAWAANDVGEKSADFFYPISIVEKETILAKCIEIGIDGICSIASDLAIITVNYVADKLGLNANSLHATSISTNKYLMRQAFEKHGDPSPKSFLVDDKTDYDKLEITFPTIIKPTDRSGSRGIYKINSKDEIKDAVESAMKEGFEKKALVEEFVEGQEYSAEYISFHGKHHFLALTLKYTTGAPHFIETGHLEPAPIDDVTLEKVKTVVEHALDSLEITEGASHSEFKIDDDGDIKIIEIGGRMAGDCIGSDLVRYSTGIDYVRAVIDVACGRKPNLKPDVTPQPAKVEFIFTEEDKKEFERIKVEYPKRILRIADDKHFDLIGKTTNSSNRAGCYILKA